MNNKILTWIFGILLLTSLVCATSVEDIKNEVNSVFPGLIAGDARMSETEARTVVKHVKQEPVDILKNQKDVQILSADAWRGELLGHPPRSKKVDNCMKKESKTRKECIDLLLNKYMDKFKFTDEERAEISLWSDEEKTYVVATLARSRGEKSLIVYWMLRHPQFNYIKFHENFHTYTAPQVNMLKQIDLIEGKIDGATGTQKAELQKKLDIQKQQAAYVILWIMYVGGPMDVFITWYGQSNLYESLAEFFAMFWTHHLVEDFKTTDRDNQDRIMAAIIISKCFGLDKSMDGIYGKEVFDEFLDLINNDINLVGRYNVLDAQIRTEAGSCPPFESEPMTYSGDGYLCRYKLEENGKEIDVEGCEYIELENHVVSAQPGFESNYVVKGSVRDIGYLNFGEYVITEVLGDGDELFGGSSIDFEPFASGLVVITGNVDINNSVVFYKPNSETTELEIVAEVNVKELAEITLALEKPLELEELGAEGVDEFLDWQVRMIDNLNVLNGELNNLNDDLIDIQNLLGVEPGCYLASTDVSDEVQNNIESNQREIDELMGKILQGEDVVENQNEIRDLIFGNLLSDEQKFLDSQKRVITKLNVLNDELNDLNDDLKDIQYSLNDYSKDICLCEKGAWATYMCNELKAEQEPEQESYSENGVDVLFRETAGHWMHGEWHGFETLSESTEMDTLPDHGPFISCRKDVEIEGASPCNEKECDTWCKLMEPSEALLYSAINKFCKEEAEEICGSEPIHIADASNPYYFPQYGISSGFYAEGYCEDIEVVGVG